MGAEHNALFMRLVAEAAVESLRMALLIVLLNIMRIALVVRSEFDQVLVRADAFMATCNETRCDTISLMIACWLTKDKAQGVQWCGVTAGNPGNTLAYLNTDTISVTVKAKDSLVCMHRNE